MHQIYPFGDFSFMSEEYFIVMLKHVLHVVEGIPDGMKGMGLDPGNDGFDSDLRKKIVDELKTTELGVRILHDDSYRRIMDNIHNIASMGWEDYVERHLYEERLFYEEEMRLQEEFGLLELLRSRFSNNDTDDTEDNNTNEETNDNDENMKALTDANDNNFSSELSDSEDFQIGEIKINEDYYNNGKFEY